MKSSDRQTPEGDEIFLDHVGWFVADMTAAARDFERLGFALTPYTQHTNEAVDGRAQPSGTANRCAMLGQGYLEVLTDVADLATPLARQFRDALARYAGVHLIAFSCADAEVQHARIAAAGVALQPLVRLRRPVAMADGGNGVAAFSVIRVAPEAMPEGRIQMLVQETPELVWQERFIARANAIEALAGVLLCVADPIEAGQRFARFLGRPAVSAGGAVRIALDRGSVALAGPEAAARLIPGWRSPQRPFIAAVALRSRDLAESRRFLAGNGLPIAEPDGGTLWIAPELAAGAWIAITESDPPWR